LKLTPIAIVEALIIYDEKVLNPQTCDLLLSILPSLAEINQVDSFDGDPMTLADADQFVLLMKTAPGYDLRIKSILFKKCYKEEKEEIFKRIQKFFTALEFISSNKKFHKWLEIVLAYGNYLNGATNRGGAFAYRLDILTKLAELKSNDTKKNLMSYIVEYIGDVVKDDELLNLSKDLEIFSSCTKLYLIVIFSVTPSNP
jgi:diaphanous 1